MRQRLPGREVGSAGGRQQRVQRGGQVLGLAGRGGDGEHEPRLLRRQRGGEDRAEGRRADEIGASSIGRASMAGLAAGHFQCAPQLRIVGDNSEKTGEAHCIPA